MKKYRGPLVMMLALLMVSFVIMAHSMTGGSRTLSELWQSNQFVLGSISLLFALGLVLYIFDKKSDF